MKQVYVGPYSRLTVNKAYKYLLDIETRLKYNSY